MHCNIDPGKVASQTPEVASLRTRSAVVAIITVIYKHFSKHLFVSGSLNIKYWILPILLHYGPFLNVLHGESPSIEEWRTGRSADVTTLLIRGELTE